jgi:hypothetical protein
VEEDKDLAVDGRSEGSLAICAVVLASYETLLPLFDGDERRTILYLQHAMGPVLRRPYDLMFSTLNERKGSPRQDRQGVPQDGRDLPRLLRV